MIAAIAIDRSSVETLQMQIYQELRRMMRINLLKAGGRLPSCRLLARELGVSRNTVSYVYARLESEGYLTAKPGSGTTVADHTVDPVSWLADATTSHSNASPALQQYKVREPAFETMLSMFSSRPAFGQGISLRPFTPDLRQFPFKIWRQLMARRSMRRGDDLFGYSHMMMLGFMPLRRAIADYLVANRGAHCDWRQVVITNGAQGAINLIARILVDKDDTVWMEEPGYHWARFAFLSRGARLAPLEVDPKKGWQVVAPERPVQLIYTTPSCQQPLCKFMPLETRRELIEVAAQKGAWIVEDDYDNEFRKAPSYIPAIQGLDGQGRTIYVGTFSKNMFPALRLGFMVVPEALIDVVERTIFATGHVASLPPQAALCDFLEEGHFALHVRRMRSLYAKRREAFLDLSAQQLSSWLTPVADCVGLQIPFLVRDDQSDIASVGERVVHSLNAMQLSPHYHHGLARHGYVLGYAALSEPELASNLRTLREILATNPPV